MILRRYELRYGVHLNTNMRVGKGLLIVHGNGVYLNCKEIGDCFTVYQNVTLGMNKSVDRVPIVGDHVTVYTGAVVVGKLELGDGCSVGANAFVASSVAAHTTVAGNPAERIK